MGFESLGRDVPVTYSRHFPDNLRPKPPKYELDPMVKRETLELVRAYYKIENADVRQRLYHFTKAVGAAGG